MYELTDHSNVLEEVKRTYELTDHSNVLEEVIHTYELADHSNVLEEVKRQGSTNCCTYNSLMNFCGCVHSFEI